MSLDTIAALILFALLMVGTPGPANILAMAAGANWGLRACLPFIVGLTCGKLLLNTLMALGLLVLLSAQPVAAQVLRVVSGLYLLWLAWRIAGLRLQKAEPQSVHSKPGFFAGLVVHPLNPKAWAMLTSAYAQFANPEGDWLLQSVAIILTFFVINAVMHPLWCFSGAKIAATLGGSVWERALMIALALSVVLLVLWSMWGHW